jgi:hypothetical protein
MHECCMFVPYALVLSDRVSGKRVWFKVYDDAEELVQKVLDFALTTTPDFYHFAMSAYEYWVRNGRTSHMWDPKMFLDIINERTYFLWSSAPNFDLRTDESENDWTPAAKEWADVYLQEWLYPSPNLSNSVYPEFFVRPSEADRFADCNRISILDAAILDPKNFLTEVRKTRFLTLGLPAVTFVQAVSEQMIPSLYRAVDIEVPARMIKWAQDLDLLVCGELSQGRKPVEDALMASLTLRNLGPAIIGAEQFDLGADVYTKAYMSGLL